MCYLDPDCIHRIIPRSAIFPLEKTVSIERTVCPTGASCPDAIERHVQGSTVFFSHADWILALDADLDPVVMLERVTHWLADHVKHDSLLDLQEHTVDQPLSRN